ncbi:PspC domain-containing protein [Weissella sp. GP1]|jgi:phage shock protein PspC (stress-responsive transcriptional regulator)|uniref:PspC domain-containing protein n=1 Tax=Weissella confusa TaxID=1583 RepID=A0AAJ3DB10_WEICO|nr:PspC domain-containing protein [Weissella confusa]MBJ7695241.1 PspC domain-containing protein [Weissella confusa]NBA11776.1 PspC domain-containing protein [Weissella confusa]QBZ05681.1 PspC domain-containing protein [Weissella confusa]
MSKKQLTKSRDKVISGVIGGFAEFFGIDATLLRIIFATVAFFFFPLVILYIVAAVVMPEPSSHNRYEYRDNDDRKDVTPHRYDDDI